MDACDSRRRIDDHFSGVIDADDERAMRAHVASCESCRAYYRRRVLLAKLDPASLGAEARLVQGLGLLREPTRRPAYPLAVSTAGVLLVAAALVLFVRSRAHDDGFTARGGGPSSLVGVEASEEESSIQVYRVPRGSDPRLAHDVVGRNDELAFAYANVRDNKRLMIFGLDETKRIYWFFPAWTSDTENPVAVAIEPGPEPHELREAIGHHFEGSRLEIHALFLDEPLTVRQVEAMIAGGSVAVPGSRHVIRSFALTDR